MSCSRCVTVANTVIKPLGTVNYNAGPLKNQYRREVFWECPDTPIITGEKVEIYLLSSVETYIQWVSFVQDNYSITETAFVVQYPL